MIEIPTSMTHAQKRLLQVDGRAGSSANPSTFERRKAVEGCSAAPFPCTQHQTAQKQVPLLVRRKNKR